MLIITVTCQFTSPHRWQHNAEKNEIPGCCGTAPSLTQPLNYKHSKYLSFWALRKVQFRQPVTYPNHYMQHPLISSTLRVYFDKMVHKLLYTTDNSDVPPQLLQSVYRLPY